MIENIAHRFLLQIDPEKAHEIAKNGMKKRRFAPGNYYMEGAKLFNKHVDNFLGLAAGFDKYAELQDVVRDYGFGWIEEGSFTYRGGEGNSKPRIFRLEGGCLLNRVGLPCIPAYEAAEILKHADQDSFAVNIAKTHDPNIIGDKAIEDVSNSYKLLKNLGIYTVINLSCPNTIEGKTFEEPESLDELLSELEKIGKGRPLLIKLSPNLTKNRIRELVKISHDRIDGYEAVNTLPSEHKEYGKGGKSGPFLLDHALPIIKTLREIIDPNKVIIGCGGIFTGADMYEMKMVGANAFLAFTGFVYGGPKWAHKVNKQFEEILREESKNDN